MGNSKVISFILIVLSIVTCNITSQSQDGEWSPVFTINPDATPLEIIGGNVIPGWDTYILLVKEAIYDEGVDVDTKTIAPNTLGVYNINEADPNIVTSSPIPIDGPAFGFAHTIVNLDQSNFFGGQGPSVTAIVDNFFLKSLTTNDGINWQKWDISNNPFYGSAEVASDPLNPGVIYAGGCNTVNDSYDLFESFDSGQTWVPVINIFGDGGPLVCALEDGTRCTFDVHGGQHAVFCGQLVNNALELFINRGNGNEVIDTDIFPPTVLVRESNRLKISENNSPLPRDRTFFNYTYFHNQTNTVKDASFIMRGQQQQQSPIIVQTLGAAPNAVDFFGIAMSEGPPGTANVLYPGSHFQIIPSNQFFAVNPFQGVEIIDVTGADSPLLLIQDGPLGSTPGEFGQGIFEYSIGFRFNSYDYAAFKGIIPATPIPTLSEWGLIALAGVLMLSGAFYLRRKKVMS